MEISSMVVVAVLLGALLHASWNALIKSSSDKSLDTALIHSMGGVAAIPLLCWTGWPDSAAWPCLLASTAVHLGYYATLAAAYQHGDFGMTYPVMRGTAPLLVALGSPLLMGEALGLGAWLGIAAICTGVLLLGLTGRQHSSQKRSQVALGFALLNAVLIAAYTVIDGLGVRAAGHPLAYVAVLFLLDAFPYMVLTLWRRKPPARRQALAYCRSRWPVAAVGTFASLGSYGIALWAMTLMPVAVVAALRESSVLFALALGALLFHERWNWPRGIGVAAIVLGVWLIRAW